MANASQHDSSAGNQNDRTLTNLIMEQENHALKAEKKSWYCVRSKVKREELAARILEEQRSIDTFCPLVRLRRKTVKGRKWFKEAMFPGYFFALFNFGTEIMTVRSCHGVTGVVHFGNRYAHVPDSVIEELERVTGEENICNLETKISAGNEVEVTEGPFEGLIGRVLAKRNGKERVFVLFDFLGSQVKAEMKRDVLMAKK